MRLEVVIALAGAALAGLPGLPGLVHTADAGTLIVGFGLVLGLLSALAPRPPQRQPVAHSRRLAR